MKAVVLAGGKSSRMGQDKALMTLGDQTILQRVLNSIFTVFDEIYVSGSYQKYHLFSKHIIEDDCLEKGPMGGIFSALQYCQEDLLVCSCDMPFVSPALIEYLMKEKKEGHINVIKNGEKIYPVLGIYPFSVLDSMKESIENNHLKMTSFLETQNAHYIAVDKDLEDELLNINTPENFKIAEFKMNQNLLNTL